MVRVLQNVAANIMDARSEDQLILLKRFGPQLELDWTNSGVSNILLGLLLCSNRLFVGSGRIINFVGGGFKCMHFCEFLSILKPSKMWSVTKNNIYKNGRFFTLACIRNVLAVINIFLLFKLNSIFISSEVSGAGYISDSQDWAWHPAQCHQSTACAYQPWGKSHTCRNIVHCMCFTMMSDN